MSALQFMGKGNIKLMNVACMTRKLAVEWVMIFLVSFLICKELQKYNLWQRPQHVKDKSIKMRVFQLRSWRASPTGLLRVL